MGATQNGFFTQAFSEFLRQVYMGKRQVKKTNLLTAPGILTLSIGLFTALTALELYAKPQIEVAAKPIALVFMKATGIDVPGFVRKKEMRLHNEALDAGFTHSLVDTSLAWFDFNQDKKKELCVSYASSLFGNTGGEISCYTIENKKYKRIIRVIAAPAFIELPGSKTNGFYDLTFGAPGFNTPKVWKWNSKTRSYQ